MKHTGLDLGEVQDVGGLCHVWSWSVTDEKALARIVALLIKTEYRAAKLIVHDLSATTSSSATGGVAASAIKAEAVELLQIVAFATNEDTSIAKKRERRDGLLFECISWVAARQQFGPNALVRNPHVKATHQGLDGVVIIFDGEPPSLQLLVVLEEKCTKTPRRMFKREVLPAFVELQSANAGRWREFSAAARETLDLAKLDDDLTEELAKQSMELELRSYRAALAGPPTSPCPERLFKNYDEVQPTHQPQRMGATLIPSQGLRPWFDQFASKVIAAL